MNSSVPHIYLSALFWLPEDSETYRNLQIAEANLSSLKSQLKAKQDEAKGNQTPTISV